MKHVKNIEINTALINEDLDSLDLSEYDNMFMDENYAVADYIKKIISILEGEK